MLTEATRLWTGDLSTANRTHKMQLRVATDVFLIHARNLLDFFAPRPTSRPTDVQAGHYVESWSCSDGTLLAGQPIKEWRYRIDKALVARYL